MQELDPLTLNRRPTSRQLRPFADVYNPARVKCRPNAAGQPNSEIGSGRTIRYGSTSLLGRR